jgi:hypothetical protein
MYTSNDLFKFIFASLLTRSHSTHQEKQGIRAGLWISVSDEDLGGAESQLPLLDPKVYIIYTQHTHVYISSSSSSGYLR